MSSAVYVSPLLGFRETLYRVGELPNLVGIGSFPRVCAERVGQRAQRVTPGSPRTALRRVQRAPGGRDPWCRHAVPALELVQVGPGEREGGGPLVDGLALGVTRVE